MKHLQCARHCCKHPTFALHLLRILFHIDIPTIHEEVFLFWKSLTSVLFSLAQWFPKWHVHENVQTFRPTPRDSDLVDLEGDTLNPYVK